MNTFENPPLTMSLPTEQLYLNFFQQQSSQSEASSDYQHSNRNSVCSSRASKADSSKQGLSKRQSLPTTIQERVAHGERYKSEMCKQFQLYKTCRYDNKCQYAHGESELRSINRHPKYKTEQCRTYHTTGFCPYGARCHFVHDQNSTTKPRQQSNNNKRRLSTSKSLEATSTQSESTTNNHVHDYQMSILVEQQKQLQQQSLEQVQFQILQQIQQQQIQQHLQQQQQQQQQQQFEVETFFRSASNNWQPTYNLPTYTNSTGSHTPLTNSDSERSTPTTMTQTPVYNLFYPSQEAPTSQTMPLYRLFGIPPVDGTIA